MFYKNTSYSVKTFYGVTFEPGQTYEVDGIISDPLMIVVERPADPVVLPEVVEEQIQQKPSPVKPKKETKPAEELVVEEVVATEETVVEESNGKTKKSK